MRQINTNFLWTAGIFERWILSNNNKTQQNKSNFSVKSSHVKWQVATRNLTSRNALITSKVCYILFQIIGWTFFWNQIDWKNDRKRFRCTKWLGEKTLEKNSIVLRRNVDWRMKFWFWLWYNSFWASCLIWSLSVWFLDWNYQIIHQFYWQSRFPWGFYLLHPSLWPVFGQSGRPTKDVF